MGRQRLPEDLPPPPHTPVLPLLGLLGRIRLGRVKGAFGREICIAMEECVSAKSLRNGSARRLVYGSPGKSVLCEPGGTV